MRLSAVLKLVRLSALPSAWADQFGGMALAAYMVGRAGYWRFEPEKILPLLIASFGVYLGGMALNDVLHVRKDELLGKKRPIPAGELSLTQGWIVTLALFAVGTIAGFIAGCGGAVLALIALIFVYNHLAAGKIVGADVKHPLGWTIASVIVIALCRGIHVCLPLMAHAGAENLPQLVWLHSAPFLFAGSVFAYFCCVTVVSLFEDRGGGRLAVRMISLILIPVTLALPLWMLIQPGTTSRPVAGVILPMLTIAVLLIGLWRKLDEAAENPIPPKLGACVGAGIRGEALLMTAFALVLAPLMPIWGLLALLMYPAGLWLGKWINPT